MPAFIQPVSHDKGLSAEDLKSGVRHAENRTGRIMDIFARSLDDPTNDETVSEHNLLDFPSDSLTLIIVGEDPIPTDKELELAGTAFVEGEKKIVAIYR